MTLPNVCLLIERGGRIKQASKLWAKGGGGVAKMVDCHGDDHHGDIVVAL